VLLSAFFWTYSILQIPVGWIAERYGAQRVLGSGLALWACATMLVANGNVAFAYQFGPAVGAYGGGLIMVHYGWRATFWIFGGLSLLWLLPW
jgi:MFS family permease